LTLKTKEKTLITSSIKLNYPSSSKPMTGTTKKKEDLTQSTLMILHQQRINIMPNIGTNKIIHNHLNESS